MDKWEKPVFPDVISASSLALQNRDPIDRYDGQAIRSLNPNACPKHMRFTPQFLEELKARLPVSEVVGRRVKLQKSGREWKGLSPFNKEKTAVVLRQ